jgi:hypothetical protein
VSDPAPPTVVSVQWHPYAGHPAALVLADHQPECVTKATPPAAPVMCCCGVMVAWCDFSAHQTGMLHRAGLLADGTPPETPTARVLAERAQRGTT